MEIKSESIRNYILDNVDIEGNEIGKEDCLKIKTICLNRLNWDLEETEFCPDELSYLTELEECAFIGFDIDDRIIVSLNNLEKLKNITFDFCKLKGQLMLKNSFNQVYLDHSDFEFLYKIENKKEIKKVVFESVKNVDINDIFDLKNLEELEILNSNVTNSDLLEKLENLKTIKIIGSALDNPDMIENLREKVNVIYSKNKFFHTA